MARRRFGVSMHEDLARRLDEASRSLGVERSRLVEKAVEALLDDYKHLLSRHSCSGIIIVSCHTGGEAEIAGAVEKFRDIVAARLHSHTRSSCIEAIIVEGDSARIAMLHRKLESLGCGARYISIPKHR
ncbi:CopG family ribbon-helix-helix protein [Aeropyrum camini]|uniref:Predicted transcriptional regulator containing the CopG/Arc/MetJ DNA-binding domain and a metal-binding domain n=1 Tax=Aeropyrum camini SY1 = JCM 12091 TaxID=1198449 RepID=U3TCW8_9CREN|nr:CopG family ribbon-helix-helix protein [Aeropyrum camini]BAN89880.1 predicted transcriptional regulator containing the CopG/Arc/MetJ DNA-binding domain and a metal-binding domain [Aeropyrum camini SY1 = JCM 12091]